jgi:hypothetical protein
MKKLIIVVLVSLLSTPCLAGMGMQHSSNSSREARTNYNERMNDYRENQRERRSDYNERMNDYRENQRERRQERREQRGSTRQRNR